MKFLKQTITSATARADGRFFITADKEMHGKQKKIQTK